MNENDLRNNKEALQAALKDLIKMVKEATDKLIIGDISELEGLDGTVNIVCMAVEKSEPEIAKAVEPLMAEMIASLEILARELRVFQEQNG